MDPNSPGSKAKLVSLLDRALADELKPLYTIDVIQSVSPRKNVLSGGIAIFKDNSVSLTSDPLAKPEHIDKAEKLLSKETEALYRDIEKCKEPDGKWIQFAALRTLEIFDELGTNAKVRISCPKLQIRQFVSRTTLVNGRGDVRGLFQALWEIDRLLRKKFSYDPWSRSVRRGKINADMGKR